MSRISHLGFAISGCLQVCSERKRAAERDGGMEVLTPDERVKAYERQKALDMLNGRSGSRC